VTVPVGRVHGSAAAAVQPLATASHGAETFPSQPERGALGPLSTLSPPVRRRVRIGVATYKSNDSDLTVRAARGPVRLLLLRFNLQITMQNHLSDRPGEARKVCTKVPRAETLSELLQCTFGSMSLRDFA
jgi:hypothetical protein